MIVFYIRLRVKFDSGGILNRVSHRPFDPKHSAYTHCAFAEHYKMSVLLAAIVKWSFSSCIYLCIRYMRLCKFNAELRSLICYLICNRFPIVTVELGFVSLHCAHIEILHHKSHFGIFAYGIKKALPIRSIYIVQVGHCTKLHMISPWYYYDLLLIFYDISHEKICTSSEPFVDLNLTVMLLASTPSSGILTSAE